MTYTSFYNRNDPINLVDPSGRYTLGDISWLYGDNAYYSDLLI
jgi:hypothetical protein